MHVQKSPQRVDVAIVCERSKTRLNSSWTDECYNTQIGCTQWITLLRRLKCQAPRYETNCPITTNECHQSIIVSHGNSWINYTKMVRHRGSKVEKQRETKIKHPTTVASCCLLPSSNHNIATRHQHDVDSSEQGGSISTRDLPFIGWSMLRAETWAANKTLKSCSNCNQIALPFVEQMHEIVATNRTQQSPQMHPIARTRRTWRTANPVYVVDVLPVVEQAHCREQDAARAGCVVPRARPPDDHIDVIQRHSCFNSASLQ